MVKKVWINVWITFEKGVEKHNPALTPWTITSLFTGKTKLFHVFLLKKDINFVILHQNTKWWIK
jgi:hypothetical protein